MSERMDERSGPTMLHAVALLSAHLLVSTAACGAALLFGPLPGQQWAAEVAVGYGFAQTAVAVLIPAIAPQYRIVMALLSLPAVAWGWWCVFIALMALSGDWL